MNKSVCVFRLIRHVARMCLFCSLYANFLGSFNRHSTFLRTKEIAGVTLYERSLLTLFSVLYCHFSVAMSFDPFLLTKKNVEVILYKLLRNFITRALYPSILKLWSVLEQS